MPACVRRDRTGVGWRCIPVVSNALTAHFRTLAKKEHIKTVVGLNATKADGAHAQIHIHVHPCTRARTHARTTHAQRTHARTHTRMSTALTVYLSINQSICAVTGLHPERTVCQ